MRSPLPDASLRERALLMTRLGYDGIELGNEWSDHTQDALKEQLAGIDIAVSAMVGSIKLLDTEANTAWGAISRWTRPAISLCHSDPHTSSC